MKILTTSDWHLDNFFHWNDRLPHYQNRNVKDSLSLTMSHIINTIE